MRYADDFVILAKHIGTRIENFLKETLEQRMELTINREKTAIRDLTRKGDNLEFLGYVFRREKAKQWRGWYDNMLPSKKSLRSVRLRIRALTEARHCYKPARQVVDEVNAVTRGWAQYFSQGYRMPAYSAVNRYAQSRIIQHLKRRSQRGYRRPSGISWYGYLEQLGLHRLSPGNAPVTAR